MVRLTLAAAWLLSAMACDPPAADPESTFRKSGGGDRTRAPDIVLVSIDSLRADHLGCYGYEPETSPTLDALAELGARFENAMSTTSWTLPSHAALFTGMFDTTHGLVDNGLRLHPGHTTLAETLRGAGYQTAGFFGGPYLHPTFGLGQGFDFYRSCMTRIASDVSGADVRDAARAEDGGAHADVTGPETVRAVSEWLDGVDERPFFLFVHLWDVHYDYIAPPEYVQRFDPDYAGDLDGLDLMGNPRIHAGMAKRDLEHLIALYDAEIRFTDDVMAQLLAALERAGRLASSIVVVTADHGEEFFEHGSRGHAQTLFDEVLRVPLLISSPGRIPAGQVIEDPVQLVDVMPTLLGLAGVSIPAGVQGRDLTPLLMGEPLPTEPALVELRLDGRNVSGLRTRSEKLLTAGDQRGMWFDLNSDPRERRALRIQGQRANRVREGLDQKLEEALAARSELGHPGAEEVGLMDALRERLESLGYLEGPGS
ncbi:sulfatase [Myxococcota bacterium]|nr:sulfatase [Myxococcota bacterium]